MYFLTDLDCYFFF